MTLVYGAVATGSATSGALTAAQAPLPAIIETIAGNFGGLQGAMAGANLSDSISIAAIANGGGLVAIAGGSVSASSRITGASGRGSLINGQNGNPGGGTNLSSVASVATMANPAPNSIFVEPDHAFRNPETIVFDSLAGTRVSAVSTVPDAVRFRRATGKAGGEVDVDFDVEGFPMVQAVSAPFADPMLMSVSAEPAQAWLRWSSVW